MKVFLHRISHHAEISYPLLDRNILTIGWCDFNSTDGAASFDEDFENSGYAKLSRSRWGLYRFLFEMQPDDWVVVPSWQTFRVYKVESTAFPVNELQESDLKGLEDWHGRQVYLDNSTNLLKCSEDDKIIDLGFCIRVSLLEKDIPRAEYTDAMLASRMKIRQTNADITDLQKHVEEAVEAFRLKCPIKLSSKIMAEVEESVYGIITDYLTPDKWEQLIRLYFEKLGATSIEIPAKNESSKEGDSDIVATFEALRTIYYVQAKFHKGVTESDWALKQVDAYTGWKNETGEYSTVMWVISSAEDFSETVKTTAKEKDIQLISGPEFIRMLLENGIARFDEI